MSPDPGRSGGLAIATRIGPLPATRTPLRTTPFAANATLVERRDLTDSIARLSIRPDDGVASFVPGQYFALGLSIDGRVIQRPYSTASAADPAHRTTDELEFLVRLVPGGAFTTRLWALRPADRLRIGPPKGLFTLRPGDERTHLLVSTGTGLAPFIAMTAALRARREAPRVVVVHGVADVAELAYRDRLERWSADEPRIAYHPSITRPERSANAGWTGAVGRIDAVLPSVLEAVRIDPSATVAYLCGHPGMIDAVGGRLLELGLPPAAIVTEQYWPDPEPARPA